jgi:hypothetical protein
MKNLLGHLGIFYFYVFQIEPQMYIGSLMTQAHTNANIYGIEVMLPYNFVMTTCTLEVYSSFGLHLKEVHHTYLKTLSYGGY